MDMKQYQQEAQATKSPHYFCPWELTYTLAGQAVEVSSQDAIDIEHAIIGLTTECGESLDVVKKGKFYNKPIDLTNLDEELGDKLWYIAIYCKARGTSIEELATKNIAKLKARYPEKFTQYHAMNRNLEEERKILES